LYIPIISQEVEFGRKVVKTGKAMSWNASIKEGKIQQFRQSRQKSDIRETHHRGKRLREREYFSIFAHPESKSTD